MLIVQESDRAVNAKKYNNNVQTDVGVSVDVQKRR
jgi:hypothetical protein